MEKNRPQSVAACDAYGESVCFFLIPDEKVEKETCELTRLLSSFILINELCSHISPTISVFLYYCIVSSTPHDFCSRVIRKCCS